MRDRDWRGIGPRNHHKICNFPGQVRHTQTYVAMAYSVVTKYVSAIAHQMRRSQVLPGYPHSSGGAYATEAKSITTESQIIISKA